MTVHGTDLEAAKIACLSTGIRLSPAAVEVLSNHGQDTLSVHEYPTTGGVTLVLDEDVYVNAPFDEWYCERATTVLDVTDGGLALLLDDDPVPVRRVLPLPGYLDALDPAGRRVADVAMSHTDRIRLSPLVGCAYDCGFCDLADMAYVQRQAEQLLHALDVALSDVALPPRHVLISGGSPRKTHYEQFISTCEEVITASPLPVDVMFSPMVDNLEIVDRLVDAGAAGFAINIELYSDDSAKAALGRKYNTARRHFEATVTHAVERLGRDGRVRSLIIAGLEPPEQTVRGVEYLASLGCDPVLSPFRPADGTRLKQLSPPSPSDLAGILNESRAVVARYGVALGPTCGPCQHNTLTFPWDPRPADRAGAGLDPR